MHKTSPTALASFAIAMMLTGHAHAQHAAAANSEPAPSTQAKPDTAADVQPLTTQKDKLSYAIGMNIGANLHRQPLDIDPQILARGLRDALAGGATALTPAEARTILAETQQQLHAAEQEKMAALATANKTQGEAFLAANKTKPGVVTLPSGLEYKILRPGTGPKPTASDTVICNYSGSLIDGTEFDSSYKRGRPVTIPVARVIKGWTEALQLMPVGSKWQLFVPADLAYGDRPAGAEIGPDATLIFEVELLSIKPPAQSTEPSTAPSSAAPTSAAPSATPQSPSQSQ